jgi:hypothetical protein
MAPGVGVVAAGRIPGEGRRGTMGQLGRKSGGWCRLLGRRAPGHRGGARGQRGGTRLGPEAAGDGEALEA